MSSNLVYNLLLESTSMASVHDGFLSLLGLLESLLSFLSTVRRSESEDE